MKDLGAVDLGALFGYVFHEIIICSSAVQLTPFRCVLVFFRLFAIVSASPVANCTRR